MVSPVSDGRIGKAQNLNISDPNSGQEADSIRILIRIPVDFCLADFGV